MLCYSSVYQVPVPPQYVMSVPKTIHSTIKKEKRKVKEHEEKKKNNYRNDNEMPGGLSVNGRWCGGGEVWFFFAAPKRLEWRFVEIFLRCQCMNLAQNSHCVQITKK